MLRNEDLCARLEPVIRTDRQVSLLQSAVFFDAVVTGLECKT